MKKLLFLVSMLCTVVTHAQGPYTFVFLNKKTEDVPLSKEKTAEIMKGHMANIERLAKEGKLVAAGPFEGGGGIFILKTSDRAEAQAWLAPDPGIQAKRWHVELFPFSLRQGSICAVSEPYEMVNYTFVRFDAVVSKFTASTYPQVIKKHDDYLKQLANTGNVIAEGIFGPNDGGILIMRGEVQREIFETDAGVQEGLMELIVTKLFIARGTFCEK